MNKKNYISIISFIVMLLIIIGLVICIVFVNKKDEKQTTSTYTYNKNKTICQRNYYYNDKDSYRISVCNKKAYISKNGEKDKDLSIKEDVAYLYNFVTPEGNAIYFLSDKGNVYNLSQDNIKNDKYEIAKLDVKDITNIGLFYIGVTKDDAYNNRIFAIDRNGKMFEIKK